jgi:hypothetical protein
VIGVPFPHDACAMIEDCVVRLLWRIGDAMPIQLLICHFMLLDCRSGCAFRIKYSVFECRSVVHIYGYLVTKALWADIDQA